MKRIIAATVIAAFAFGASAQDGDATAEEAAYIAQLEQELGGQLMNSPLTLDYETYGTAEFKTKQVRAADAPGGAGYQVRVTSAGRNPWDVTTQVELDGAVAKGDMLRVAFWANAAKAPKSGEPYVTARIQQKDDPYTGVLEQGFALQKGWKLYEMAAPAQAGFGDGEINLVLNVGDRKQSVEFGQLFVVNHSAK